MTPFQFGVKTANKIRLPHNYEALRNVLISAAVGGALGGGRGLLVPGYDEKFDDAGNVMAKKRIKPWIGALQGAGIGAVTGAASNYAAQTAAQYNPEIDKLLKPTISSVLGH